MSSRVPGKLVRPLVAALSPYAPGEQPRIKGLIKLNTNENPYPPSPKVLAAVKEAVDGRLRLYPHPTADRLREKLARLHRCKPANIIVGNGSDELLAMAVRAFVEPASSSPEMRRSRANAARSVSLPSRCVVQYFTPSYSLYSVLADIHGAAKRTVALGPDFALPDAQELRRRGAWDIRAALTFVTTPNAPSGRAYATADLERLCLGQKGVVVLDEAYVEFGKEHAIRLALTLPHVLVARTFSKAYSLCFQRIGYFVGHPDLIAALHKIRDSYNVNGLGQIAAEATLDDLPYYRSNFREIIATRNRLSRQLEECGFQVWPSRTNFILVKPPRFPAKTWLQMLRDKKILVRWFDQTGVRECLRITIGTPAEASALVSAVTSIARQSPAP